MAAIGIIGYGNIGGAVAHFLRGKYRLFIFDQDSAKTAKLPPQETAAGCADLAQKAQALIIAVKPQDLAPVLSEIKGGAAGKLVISVCAGISTKYVEDALPGARVVRAMPNVALKIGESMTCIAKGASAAEEDFTFVRELFYSLGVALEIDERLMNAATAICGSGPAYVFDYAVTSKINGSDIPAHTRHDLMKRLGRAAEAVGFSAEDAAFIAVNTFNSSVEMLRRGGHCAEELKKMVASKGGTTEKALEVLHQGGTWEEAALAALKRAQELVGGR
jgi:pyrroline-5-carboxylate reductase